MPFRRLGSSSLPKGHTTTNAADGQNMALTWTASQAWLTTGLCPRQEPENMAGRQHGVDLRIRARVVVEGRSRLVPLLPSG
jgi:hypothetical protein